MWGGGVAMSVGRPDGPAATVSEVNRRTFSSSRFFRQAALGFRFLSVKYVSKKK